MLLLHNIIGYPGDGLKKRRGFWFDILSRSGRLNEFLWSFHSYTKKSRDAVNIQDYGNLIILGAYLCPLYCIDSNCDQVRAVKALGAIFTVLPKKDKERNPQHYWLILITDGWSAWSLCCGDTKKNLATDWKVCSNRLLSKLFYFHWAKSVPSNVFICHGLAHLVFQSTSSIVSITKMRLCLSKSLFLTSMKVTQDKKKIELPHCSHWAATMSWCSNSI